MSRDSNQLKAGNRGGSISALGGPAVASGTSQWSVSTRSIGEVLTTEIRSDGLRLLLFARPTDESARQIEARLGELLAADGGPDTEYSSTGAVPAPLQRAVDVLLQLVADVERVTHRRAGALALYQSSREVACAYIGGGEPDVWSHDEHYDAPWVELREGVDAGGGVPVARGFAVFAREDLNMKLQWPYLVGTPKPEGVVVEARWQAPQGFEVLVRELTADGQTRESKDGGAVSAAAASGNGEERGDFFAGWFDDLTRGMDQSSAALAGTDAPRYEAPEEIAEPPRAIPPLPQRREQETIGELEAVADMAQEPIAEAAPEAVTDPAARTRPAIAFPDLLEELRTQIEDSAGDSAPPVVEVSAAPVASVQPVAPSHTPDVEVASPISGLAGVDRIAPEEVAEVFTPEPVGATIAGPLGAERDVSSAVSEVNDNPASFAPPGRSARRPQGPAFVGTSRGPADWKQRARWAAFIAVLFAIGWWVGTRGGNKPVIQSHRAPLGIRMLRAVGIGSSPFTAVIASNPPGARIVIDGKLSSFRTPAEIELAAGSRRVGLTLPGLGTVTTTVIGTPGASVDVEVPLTGTLAIAPPNASTPVSVTIDGEAFGLAPVALRKLAPGVHELSYTSPGQSPWSQTVTVPLRGDVRVVARPFNLPAAGVIHVDATWIDDDGSSDLRGATVIIDCERRGVTPLTLELPRGPHSMRAEYQGEEVPVQVIDLPGGNERYASFTFGTGGVFPRLVLKSPLSADSRDATVRVALQDLSAGDVREAWLHVRSESGSWRRYPMNIVNGDADPLAVVTFPASSPDSRGEAPFYVSALISSGEEYFTEVYGNGVHATSLPARKPPVIKHAASTSRSTAATVRITPSAKAPADAAPLPTAEPHPAPVTLPATTSRAPTSP